VASIDGLDAFNRRCRFFANRSAGAEAVDISVERVEGVDVHLWRTVSRSGFLAAPKASVEPDLILVQLLRRGSVLCRGPLRDHLVEAGSGLMVPFSDIAELRASGDHEEFGFAFSRSTLERRQRELSADDASTALPEFEATADLHTPAFRSFSRNLATLFSRRNGDGGDLLDVPFIEDLLIHQLIGAWPQRPSRHSFSAPASSRHVLRSLEFIEANLTRPIAVAEIAAAAGIGVRALQSSFRKDLGRTPIQHIIDRRLEQAHGELRRDGRSPIAVIAARWGFVHMSDFSRRYRQRFGCTPSQTQIRSTRID
jgi:AraC-like DNA-binding protein